MLKRNADVKSRELSVLIPKLQPIILELIANCKKRKTVIVPFSTLRGPLTQARTFTKGRTRVQVEARRQEFVNLGCPFLAACMEIALKEMPRKLDPKEKIVTRALPGQSWHQWGEAVDFYVEGKDKKEIWDGSHIGYKILQEEAQKLGLTSGLSFTRLPDPVHIQLSSLASPNHSFVTLDRFITDRFTL